MVKHFSFGLRNDKITQKLTNRNLNKFGSTLPENPSTQVTVFVTD